MLPRLADSEDFATPAKPAAEPRGDAGTPWGARDAKENALPAALPASLAKKGLGTPRKTPWKLAGRAERTPVAEPRAKAQTPHWQTRRVLPGSTPVQHAPRHAWSGRADAGQADVLRASALTSLPNATQAAFWIRRATALDAAGQPEEALATLRQALQRDVAPATDISRAIAHLEAQTGGRPPATQPGSVASVAPAADARPKSATPLVERSLVRESLEQEARTPLRQLRPPAAAPHTTPGRRAQADVALHTNDLFNSTPSPQQQQQQQQQGTAGGRAAATAAAAAACLSPELLGAVEAAAAQQRPAAAPAATPGPPAPAAQLPAAAPERPAAAAAAAAESQRLSPLIQLPEELRAVTPEPQRPPPPQQQRLPRPSPAAAAAAAPLPRTPRPPQARAAGAAAAAVTPPQAVARRGAAASTPLPPKTPKSVRVAPTPGQPSSLCKPARQSAGRPRVGRRELAGLSLPPLDGAAAAEAQAAAAPLGSSLALSPVRLRARQRAGAAAEQVAVTPVRRSARKAAAGQQHLPASSLLRGSDYAFLPNPSLEARLAGCRIGSPESFAAFAEEQARGSCTPEGPAEGGGSGGR